MATLALSFLASGCSFLPQKEEPQVVAFEYSEPNRISFEGKGAGAGFALMSTMGSMGIALGVAIDEGIAKDIRTSVKAAGFDINESVSEALARVSAERYVAEFSTTDGARIKVLIKKYGFQSKGGGDDLTTAKIDLEVVNGENSKITIRYPNDFENSDIEISTYPLVRLKEEGELAKLLLDEALVVLLRRAFK